MTEKDLLPARGTNPVLSSQTVAKIAAAHTGRAVELLEVDASRTTESATAELRTRLGL